MAGEADDELALEGMRLVWPAYFADPDRAPPMPELRIASERSAEMVPSILAELLALEAGLPGIRVLVGFVHGSRSPMPLSAKGGGPDYRAVRAYAYEAYSERAIPRRRFVLCAGTGPFYGQASGNVACP